MMCLLWEAKDSTWPLYVVHASLQEQLLSRQGQQGWNQLLDLLQTELVARPADTHVNVKLVQLFCQKGRLDEAVQHCLATEKKGLLRNSLNWYKVVLQTLQVRSKHVKCTVLFAGIFKTETKSWQFASIMYCCRIISLSQVSLVMRSHVGNIKRSFSWPTATCSESHFRKTMCSPAWMLSDSRLFNS